MGLESAILEISGLTGRSRDELGQVLRRLGFKEDEVGWYRCSPDMGCVEARLHARREGPLTLCLRFPFTNPEVSFDAVPRLMATLCPEGPSTVRHIRSYRQFHLDSSHDCLELVQLLKGERTAFQEQFGPLCGSYRSHEVFPAISAAAD